MKRHPFAFISKLKNHSGVENCWTIKYKIDMLTFGGINISMVVKMKEDACSVCLQPQQAEQMRMEVKDGAVGMGKCSISSEKPELPLSAQITAPAPRERSCAIAAIFATAFDESLLL